MFSSVSRAARVLAALGASAVVATACGALADRPELMAAAEPTPQAQPPLPAAPEVDAAPELHAPELLGFDDALAQARAFGLASGPSLPGPALAEGAGDEGAGAGEDRPVANDLAYVSEDAAHTADGVPTPDVEPVAGTGAGADPTGVASAAAEPRPEPPPVPAASLPRYEDPSDLIVGASGRPFPLVGGSGAAGARGVTRESIRVSGLVSKTLAEFGYRRDVCAGAKARFAQANVHHELGRDVEFDACHDDGGRSGSALAAIEGLAADDIFAVVPLASPAFAAEASATRLGLPYIGGDVLPGYCGRTNPMGFGVRGAVACPVLDARGYVHLAEPVLAAYRRTWPQGREPSIVYAVEHGPRGAAVAAARRFEAQLLGVSEPDIVAVLPTAAEGEPADWAGVARQILTAGADTIMFEGTATAGLPAALRHAGFGGELVMVGHLDPLDIVEPEQRVDLAPLTVISPGLDLATRSSRGWRALEGAAAAVGTEPDAIGLDFVEGYLAADLFVRALAATPEPLSAPAMVDEINNGFWYPGVDGVSCGSWWPAAHFTAVPCVSISRVEVFSAVAVPVLGLVETSPQLRFELG